MKFSDRPIAITDVETSGLISGFHEIIEIAIILVDGKSLKKLVSYDVKVQLEFPERFDPVAKEVNGYNEKDWVDAVPLKRAMTSYNTIALNAAFCSQVTTFDWAFVNEAYKKTGITNLMDYHRLDIPSMAWIKLRKLGLEKLSLDSVAEFLKIEPEVRPHRAINGALKAYEVLKILHRDF